MKSYNEYTGTTLNKEVAKFLGVSLKHPAYQPIFADIVAPKAIYNMPVGFEIFVCQVDLDTIKPGDIYFAFDAKMNIHYGYASINGNEIEFASNDETSKINLNSINAIFQVITAKGTRGTIPSLKQAVSGIAA